MWERIDKRLRELGLSDADLARALGVMSQHVHNWRKRGIPARRLLEIAQALRMPRDWLLTDEIAPIEKAAGAELEQQTHDLVRSFVQLSRRDRQNLLDIAELFLDHHRDNRRHSPKK